MNNPVVGGSARLRDLPTNARFRLDPTSGQEWIVSTPHDRHPNGFVDVIGAATGSGGFFDNVDQLVHVTWMPEADR